MSNITNLIEKASREKLEPTLKAFAEANGLKIGESEGELSLDEVMDRMREAEEAIYAQFTGKNLAGEGVDAPHISIQEALTTSDVSIVFPRVISTVLQEPKEPNLFLTNSVAEEIRIEPKAPLNIEFPTVGAIQAFEMQEGAEYQRQELSFQQHMTSIRLKKIGVAASVTDEVVNQSQWPILTLYLRQMKNAINRRGESLLFQCLKQYAQVAFDNDLDPAVVGSSAATGYQTTGKKISASTVANNGSFHYNDLVKMCGIILGNRYESTDFLAHPLTWPIFATDPIMRAQFYHGGQIGGSIWTTMPKFDQQVNFPYGISYIPYYAVDYYEKKTLTNGLSGEGASLVSDLYLIDRKNSLYTAVRGDVEMDQMDNWYRDSTQLKAKKYLGVAAKDGGKGMVVAKNVRVVQNQDALFTTRTISS